MKTIVSIIRKSVQSYQFGTYAVRNAPAVNDQNGVESTAFHKSLIRVYFCFGLIVAFTVNHYRKTGILSAAGNQTCCN